MVWFLGVGVVLMFAIISAPAAGLLCAAVCMVMHRRPHRRKLLNRGAWVVGSGALAVSALGIGAIRSQEPARLPFVGIQTEEILWPAMPLALACLAVVAITRRSPRGQPARPKLSRGRRLVLDGTAALAVALTLCWFASAWPLLPPSLFGQCWGNSAFDSQQWQSMAGDFDSTRGVMVRSLLRDWRPSGRERTEVLAVLGEPDAAEGRVFEYFVGVYDLEDTYLVLHFDSRGRVEGWSIY